MRQTLHRTLQEWLGPPARSHDGCDWWECKHGRRLPLTICLDTPVANELVHVLVFDPARPNGACVQELTATAMEEIPGVIDRLKHLIEPEGCEAPSPPNPGRKGRASSE